MRPLLSAVMLLPLATTFAQKSADVFIYGSTPGGIIAAVAAARLGGLVEVVLADPSPRIGGLVAGGLSFTDKGDTFAIGGLAHEFFVRVGQHYNASSTEPVYAFEPHVAELVFQAMLDDANVRRVPCGFIDTVSVANATIQSFTTTDGQTFGVGGGGVVFIDASYEGDLLAAAGVSAIIGREPRSRYNESRAGRVEPFSKPFDFRPVSPFVDGSSGALLPLITGATVGEVGSGDNLTQAYNYRLCVTSNVSNSIPFPKPAGYDASEWELLRRMTQVMGDGEGINELFGLNGIPRKKFDMNNGALVSTDFAGGSWAYPSANASTRAVIAAAHVAYQQGVIWTLANDPLVPARLRSAVSALGLCADEFTSNGGWPEALYVREARRLVGDVVFTAHDIDAETNYSYHSIGMGSYPMDGHYIHRGPCIPSADNRTCAMVVNQTQLDDARAAGLSIWTGGEGYPGSTNSLKLYQIPYSIILPKESEAKNLLVPVCVSASHAAFGSIRVEPQWMVIGHAAGVAAALAVEHRISVQAVDQHELHDTLRQQGAALCHVNAPACP